MKKDNRLYELRTYFANPGMLDRLVTRFERYTFDFFSKHNMQVIGLWLPLDNPENKLVYILSFADEQARAKSWEDFKSDAEWIAIKAESSRGGELMASLNSVLMHPFDLVPEHLTFGEHHVFELQTYQSTLANKVLLQEGQLNTINCWETLEPEEGGLNLLICLLAHRSADEPADRFLSNFVKSEYLQAVSFSPLK